MTIIETSYGKVQGEDLDGLHVFKGIPYAAAPVGELRWQPPIAPQPWTDVRSAVHFGNMASQQSATVPPGSMNVLADWGGVEAAEDCLTLNIWTPDFNGSDRPVMVWIHGGGFAAGTGSHTINHGQHLARYGDVVVVTINYRLGPLGFLNLNEITGGRIPATGNEGLLDQTFALQWVRENIGAFGGDADNVTIFGESAGGMSCGTLLALEPAQGLFKRAILESGACSTANTLARSVKVAERLAKQLGIDKPDDPAAWLSVPQEQLIDAGTAAAMELGSMMIFQPCIDGQVLRELPLDTIKSGAADTIDVLVGANAHEWRLMAMIDPTTVEMSFEDIPARLSAVCTGSFNHAAIIEAYREIASQQGIGEDPQSIYAAIETDRVFRMPGIRLAEALATRERPVYQYLFTAESPALGGALRSAHCIEVGFVFGTHELGGQEEGFFGSGPAADALSKTTMDAWVSFARTGNPNSERLSGWQPYTRDNRCTGIFGASCEITSAPMEHERRLWDGLADGQIVGSLQ